MHESKERAGARVRRKEKTSEVKGRDRRRECFSKRWRYGYERGRGTHQVLITVPEREMISISGTTSAEKRERTGTGEGARVACA